MPIKLNGVFNLVIFKKTLFEIILRFVMAETHVLKYCFYLRPSIKHTINFYKKEFIGIVSLV